MKPRVEFNLKKTVHKLHHNLKAFNVEKSDKSWNITFDSMKNQDWSMTSFDAQRASKLKDLSFQFTDEHITETRRVQYSSDSTQKVQKFLTSTSSTAARGQEYLVDDPSYETSPLSIGSLIPPNQEQTSHSNISEIFSTIYIVEAEPSLEDV
jgi:predicted extracellular nuclease